MKIYSPEEIPQQSDSWFKLKDLKLTSSDASAIANNVRDSRTTLVFKLVSRHFSSAIRENYTNGHLDRGNELEPVARDVYELMTGQKIEPVGFIERDEYSGASTDGLIGDKGVAEIKCPDDKEYFRVLMEMKVPGDYEWQCQYELFIAEREYADLIYYNPNFEKNMIIFRLLADPTKQEAIRRGIEAGTQLIKEYLALYEERLKETSPKVIGQEPKEELVLVFEGSKKVGAIKV